MAKSGFRLGINDVAVSLRALPLLVHANRVFRREPASQALQWLGEATEDLDLKSATCSTGDLALALRIGRAVQRAARVVPWQCDCMPQAMATCRILQHEGIDHVATIGGRMADENGREPSCTFYAHAWVSVGGEVIIGQATSELHTPLAHFSTRLS